MPYLLSLIYLFREFTIYKFFFGKILRRERKVLNMNKLTREDVKRMYAKDKEHLIFDGKNGLTKRLPIQQIEAIFPDSLLILTDIAYDVDIEGNLGVVSAVVDRFCETTEEASDYINDNCSSLLERGTPYHTGVTKFNHERCFRVKEDNNQPNFSKVVEQEPRLFVEQEEADFPFSLINSEYDRYCSIKELNYKPLYDFLLSVDISEEVVKEVVQNVKKGIRATSAPDFCFEKFVDLVIKNLFQMGYIPTECFRPKLLKMIEKNYTRLITRDRVVAFYTEEDRDSLIDYCCINQYSYSLIKSDRYLDLLSLILQDKTRKVVLKDTTMEKLSVVKAKILGLLAVKCEIRIEIISL